MPELPEVESVKLQLQRFLVGHTVKSVTINYPKMFSGDKQNLLSKVKTIRRFGKVISIDLANGYSAVIHIKLTGQIIYRGPNLKSPPPLSRKVVGGVPGAHTLMIWQLDKDGTLYYNDVRRFGWVRVVASDKLRQESKFVGDLGPEPLTRLTNSEQEELTQSKFREIVKSTKRGIKVLLMDQAKIGGVGNIYANDALWLAKIHPERKSSELTDDEIKDLFHAIEKVLTTGLKTGGASELAFVTPDGGEGQYQNHFLAYGKQGELCKRCGKAKFVKKMVGGRGTYFCPNCQR